MKTYLNIVIVEDNICISVGMIHLLQAWGYKIQGAYSIAEEALTEIFHRPPDLVLLNVFLDGDMDGIEMIHRIRSRFHFPIVLVSGALIRHLPPLPQVFILPKPFLPFQLKEIMIEALCINGHRVIENKEKTQRQRFE